MTLIIESKFRGRHIEAASPNLNLFFTMLGCSLCLVETLESSIVTLIESPVLVYWNVVATELSGNRVIGHNSSGEN